jgi:hypothetical protein
MSAGGYNSAVSPFAPSGGGLAIIIIVIVLAVARRIYRSMRGTRFTTRGLYTMPAVYLLLTAVELAAVSPTYIDVLAAIVALALGLLIGLGIGGGVQFFEKNNSIYYKRSPVIMTVWLVSFMARFGLEIAYPSLTIAAVAVDVLLAGTTGMIIGEAVHIRRNYEGYRRKAGAKEA